jgi:hypothetical protein
VKNPGSPSGPPKPFFQGLLGKQGRPDLIAGSPTDILGRIWRVGDCPIYALHRSIECSESGVYAIVPVSCQCSWLMWGIWGL